MTRPPFLTFVSLISLFLIIAALDVILSSRPAACNSLINLRNYNQIELATVVDQERASIASNCHGNGPYVGVSDGTILKWQGPRLGWTEFAFTSPNRPAACNSVINLRNYNQIDLARVVGPESIAFDCHGNGPYVGVSDGTILKWQGPPPGLGWTEFAFTSPNRPRKLCDGSTNTTNEPICGRPLGLKFNSKTCELYIADAYFGLLKTGPNGGKMEVLVNSFGGVPFMFTNALDVDEETGIVYFTDTSTQFQRREWMKSILAGDKTGRLLQYDPWTNKVDVLINGLAFANGVALSKDKSFVLVAESAPFRIHRFWLKGPKAGAFELFTQLERPPDNIKSTSKGEFWIALNSGRGVKGVEINQTSARWFNVDDPVAAKFDEQGKVVQVLDGEGGAALESVSEVEEQNGNLWVGSIVKPYVGVIKF